jgi:NADPH:quinone reductase-like Zn-dependent oxidoreductase
VATTISRAEQEEIARDAGADLILNRQTDDVAGLVRQATGNAGIDRVVDVNLVANIEVDLACLAQNGTVSAFATDRSDAVLSFPFLNAMLRGVVLRFIFVYGMPDEARGNAIREINACLAAGAYSPAIGMRLPLEQIADAHDAQDSGSVVGKILVEMGA